MEKHTQYTSVGGYAGGATAPNGGSGRVLEPHWMWPCAQASNEAKGLYPGCALEHLNVGLERARRSGTVETWGVPLGRTYGIGRARSAFDIRDFNLGGTRADRPSTESAYHLYLHFIPRVEVRELSLQVEGP